MKTLPLCACGKRFQTERQWRQHIGGPVPTHCRAVFAHWQAQRREVERRAVPVPPPPPVVEKWMTLEELADAEHISVIAARQRIKADRERPAEQRRYDETHAEAKRGRVGKVLVKKR